LVTICERLQAEIESCWIRKQRVFDYFIKVLIVKDSTIIRVEKCSRWAAKQNIRKE